MIDAATRDALTILHAAVDRVMEAIRPGQNNKCPCGDEHGHLRSHYPSRHLDHAARRLTRATLIVRDHDLGSPDSRFLVFGTPREAGRITDVCVGSAETEDEAFDKADAWLKANAMSGGAYVFAVRGFVYYTPPFEALEEPA
jgi:hypothetical protein